MMTKVLFICLGNICRSPTGEGIFKKLVELKELKDNFYIDSAGTSAYHVGESADRRMQKHCSKRGYRLTSRSRQFQFKDFKYFDYIIAMDSSNYRDLLQLDKEGIYHSKVHLMTDFSNKYFGADVPDPYYGGEEGFEKVIDIVEEASRGFLKFLTSP